MTFIGLDSKASVSISADALAYRAPFLIEKLLKDRIVDTDVEGESLFAELKRWLFISHLDLSVEWTMWSLRIDEVWHQFILFTAEYFEFCQKFFGHYIHHFPSNAPVSGIRKEILTFDQFVSRYEQMFGGSVPDVWFDSHSVTRSRRVISNDCAGAMSIRENGAMIDLVNDSGEALMSVNDIARDACSFIIQTGAFYVRELPGDLQDEEKIALISFLVKGGVLRLGS